MNTERFIRPHIVLAVHNTKSRHSYYIVIGPQDRPEWKHMNQRERAAWGAAYEFVNQLNARHDAAGAKTK